LFMSEAGATTRAASTLIRLLILRAERCNAAGVP
jgi:hypothetical protein